MLFKLALSGFKNKFKDYLVLLLGLVMSISIFYMFETLAMNDAFIKENSMISAVMFIFQIGSVLLAIITIAYCLYANSFLFSLRQKEFGMYMTLGAKKSKISLLMFIETVVIGLLSLIIGILIGIVLSRVVGEALMGQLDFESTTYQPFYLPSMLVTIIFFAILFLLSAGANLIQLSKVTVLELVHGESKAEHILLRKKNIVIQAILSLILLIIGYASMIYIEKTQYIGIVVALITITAGTYLFFSTFLPLFVQKLREKQLRHSKKINSFTYAQLSFRIGHLSRVLATVAMLIALGMGAIAVGFAFKNNGPLTAESFYPYDTQIPAQTKEESKLLQQAGVKEIADYHYKITADKIYFNGAELKAQPPLVVQTNKERKENKQVRLTTQPNVEDTNWYTFMREMIPPNILDQQQITILSGEAYQQMDADETVVTFTRLNDFMGNLDTLKKVEKIENDRHKGEANYYSSSKYSTYDNYNSFASGTVFMGFFLGFAFLTMMASSLMFKILTGATSDIRRYEMLQKIGVRRELLVKSIYKEMFFIFLFPGVVGFIHVAIGMKMFSFLLMEPYYRFYVPVTLFLVIYIIYYFITVSLYKGIVLNKKHA
ncbi:FtsX-like permease family protein [Listeria ilorinensis]|uniref:FtsX-like permease family protein n=1 Tax=Listeria ilorinensis TaxID=2867439 RepID=UPI001EF6AB2B|nr:FtsX-like permease family protein [Listeria ilorinensis]